MRGDADVPGHHVATVSQVVLDVVSKTLIAGRRSNTLTPTVFVLAPDAVAAAADAQRGLQSEEKRSL